MSWKTAKTAVTDSLGLVLVVWSIPVAILLVASPFMLAAVVVRWLQS